MKALIVSAIVFFFFPVSCLSQEVVKDSISFNVENVEKLYVKLDQKNQLIIKGINKTTEKHLSKLVKQEQKLYKRVFGKDSTLAYELFAGFKNNYRNIASSLGMLNKYLQHYSGHLDSLSTSLKLIKEAKSSVSLEKIDKAILSYKAIQEKFDQTEDIKSFVVNRRQLLSHQLEKIGMTKQLNQYKRQAYYYTAQLSEYKTIFEDPSKWENKLLGLALRSPKFKDFFARNSQLSSLFPMAGIGGGAAIPSIQGLQTRNSIQQTLQTRFPSTTSISQSLQRNIQQAQGHQNVLKSKFSSLSQGSFGNTNDDVELPDGFKPNKQKSKSFFRRLEYGANIQSKGAGNLIPVTTDLGFSLGYKLTDNSSLGIGTAYIIGWGKNISNIKLTSEGVALRSYVDLKLKGNLFVSGGYEMNYRPLVPQRINISTFPGGGIDAWQRSGLVGLSKKYKAGKKLKGDLKLLWDFLSYTQVPRTQAILFRVGYNLK